MDVHVTIEFTTSSQFSISFNAYTKAIVELIHVLYFEL